MKDVAVLAVLVTSFAGLIASHVTSVVGLAYRRPRHRATIALLVPVLAPYWAAKERMFVRAVVWGLSLALYIVARFAASG
jgi:hypothetical protein